MKNYKLTSVNELQLYHNKSLSSLSTAVNEVPRIFPSIKQNGCQSMNESIQ